MTYTPFEDQLVCRICGSSLDIIKEEERYEVDEGAYTDDGSVNEEDISFYYHRFWGCDECGWVFYSEKVYAWCNEYQLSKG